MRLTHGLDLEFRFLTGTISTGVRLNPAGFDRTRGPTTTPTPFESPLVAIGSSGSVSIARPASGS